MYKTLSISIKKEVDDYAIRKSKELGMSKSKFISDVLENWEQITNGMSDCTFQKIGEPCEKTGFSCTLFQSDALNCKFYVGRS